MSDQGVSSVAVIEEENGSLLSAISVTDIGKVGCLVVFLIGKVWVDGFGGW